MGRPTSEKVGRGLCPNASCGEPVTYRRSAGGMLTHKCDCCDSSGYAEPGGTAYHERMATIKGANLAPAENELPHIKPQDPPAPTKKAGFNLANL